MYKEVSANFLKKIMIRALWFFGNDNIDACVAKIAYFWNWTPDQQNCVHFKIWKKYQITPPYPTTIWHNLESVAFFVFKITPPYFTASIIWVEENYIDSYVQHVN